MRGRLMCPVLLVAFCVRAEGALAGQREAGAAAMCGRASRVVVLPLAGLPCGAYMDASRVARSF